MAAKNDVCYVESLISHQFVDPQWATTAITAAGADEFDHDGNRICARYGRVFIELYILDIGHKAQLPPCA